MKFTSEHADLAVEWAFDDLGAIGGYLFPDWTLTIEDTFPYLDDGTLIRWAVIADQQGPPACMDVNGPDCFLCGGGGGDTDTDSDSDDDDDDSDSDDAYKSTSKSKELGFGVR